MLKTFGKKKLVKDISASTLQTAITQAFSLLIFYFTSRYLAKDDFGEFNWSMAVGSTFIAMASLGLDVVYVKRIASGQDAVVMSGIHFFHTVMAGLVLTAMVFGVQLIFPSFAFAHPLFLMVFINLSLINIANSFRLALIGMEVYKYLAILAFITNVIKFALILFLYLQSYFTIYNVIYTFILISVLELILGYFFVSKSLSVRVKPILKIQEYKYFILESLPQLGVVFFDSALARIDWILLGIISTATVTADYSFTYRMYESSKLPLLIIAPILLTRFSKLFSDPERIDDKNRNDIRYFFKFELFVVMLIPITLACAWTPLMDFFTNNKYGKVNELNYLVLAACVPLHCISNFLWSMGFAQGQLKAIMYITLSVAVVNLGLNFFLIPDYKGMGAAISFLISTVLQTTLYIKLMNQKHIQLDLGTCLLAFVNAITAVCVGKLLSDQAVISAFIALALFSGLAVITKQIELKQIRNIIKQ
ncbi:MAG: polysaccharide biosynthesis C-terminal domain-containing protein [bacterium]|nr:polysaccharide biosynthesis C-terminal domain-containing protein [bacterium]